MMDMLFIFYSNMSNPKRHHFVPEWYLKNFTDINSGFLHIYDKRNSTFRRQKPKQVMTINNYYKQSWVPKGVDENILEKVLSIIEQNAKNAFDKLITNPKSITEEESAHMQCYLEFQRIRVPKQAKMAEKLLKSKINLYALNNDEQLATYLLSGKVEIQINDPFRFDFMRMIIGKMSPYFSRMVWEIYTAPDGYSFVTSDNPVSLYNGEAVPPMEPGIAQIGTLVLFPLNTRLLLILRHPEFFKDDGLSSLTPLEKVEMEVRSIDVYSERECAKEMVNKFNWVMLQLSDTIIVANSKGILESVADQN